MTEGEKQEKYERYEIHLIDIMYLEVTHIRYVIIETIELSNFAPTLLYFMKVAQKQPNYLIWWEKIACLMTSDDIKCTTTHLGVLGLYMIANTLWPPQGAHKLYNSEYLMVNLELTKNKIEVQEFN